MSRNPNDLKGKIFSSLTVLSDTKKRSVPAKKLIWLCQCECGNQIEVLSSSLTSGNTKSCGCLSYRKAKPISKYDQYLADLQSIFGQASSVKNRTLLPSKQEVSLIYDQEKIAIQFLLLETSHIEPSANHKRNHHLTTLTECNNLGYRCITIYENEWLSKKDKMINFMLSIFSKNTITIFGRKCTVSNITKQEATTFLNSEHIQGAAKISSYFFGLYDSNNILISVMTFGKHHRQQSIFNKSDIIVLDRFAVKSGYNIPGGASKLLSFASKALKADGKTQIISWADRRISNGNLYEKLGFTLYDTLCPDYSYWDSTNTVPTILGKQANKKSILKTPAGMTEYEHCKLLGRYRIFDCGKLVYTLSI